MSGIPSVQRVSAASCAIVRIDAGLVVEVNRSRLRNGFRVLTPLGGGLAAFPSGVAYLDSIGFQFERGSDSAGQRDLRGRVDGPECLSKFLAWYHDVSLAQREHSVARELQEELIDEHGLGLSRQFTETWVATHQFVGISNNRADLDCVTLFIQEIFAVALSPEDERVVAKATRDGGEEVRLKAVSSEEIAAGRSSEGIPIADHCYALLHGSGKRV